MIQLSYTDTALATLPLLLAIVIVFIQQRRSQELVLASARMIVQLIAIGYLLTLIFQYDWSLLGLGILSFMMTVATCIAVRPLTKKPRQQFLHVWLALAAGSVTNLVWIIGVVLKLDPWYQPSVVIPLGGMLFANCMNSLSLALERYESRNFADRNTAQSQAFNAAMIPQINGLLAVGVVSLPGMMTGQILSGVSPLIAVRYQIMVMSMIVGSSALSLWTYFWLTNKFTKTAS